MKRIVKTLLVAAPFAVAGVVFASMWPEMKRYLKMKEM